MPPNVFTFVCLLPTAYCLLPTAYCLRLPTAYCLLPTPNCLLPTAYAMSLLRINVHEHTGTIIINRPERRNALFARALLPDLDSSFSATCISSVVCGPSLLTGAGSTFCACMDWPRCMRLSKRKIPVASGHDDSLLYLELLETMLRFPKPLIAAVNGPAVAGGAGLVLASDIVVAADDARFGFPEPLRASWPGWSSPLLVFRIGGRARREFCCGQANLIDAAEAFRTGARFIELVAGSTRPGCEPSNWASECGCA